MGKVVSIQENKLCNILKRGLINESICIEELEFIHSVINNSDVDHSIRVRAKHLFYKLIDFLFIIQQDNDEVNDILSDLRKEKQNVSKT